MSLGGFAGGLSQGINSGVRISGQIQDYNIRQTAMEEAAKQRAIDDEAKAAGQTTYQQFLGGAPAGEATRMVPAEPSAATINDASPAGTLPAPESVPVNPAIPKGTPEEAQLAALQASMGVYAKHGALDKYTQLYGVTSKMRADQRTQAWDAADAEYRATKNPLVYVDKVYPKIDDGHTVENREMTTGIDGKPMISIAARDRNTGVLTTQTYSPDAFMAKVNFARNPEAVRTAEHQQAMEDYKFANETKRDAAKEAAITARETSIHAADRASAERVASGNNTAALEGHRISAGASIQAANINQSGAMEREKYRVDASSGALGIKDPAARAEHANIETERKYIQNENQVLHNRRVDLKDYNGDDKDAKLAELDVMQKDLDEQATGLRQRISAQGKPSLVDAKPVEVSNDGAALRKPVGSIVIINGRKFRVDDSGAVPPSDRRGR
jgi:hypothetical protein